jgi:hypothetical protein
MYCPECGAKIPYETARFCSECGQKLFLVSIEHETRNTNPRTSDPNQTDIAGNVKTGGGDFVGRDFNEGKSFVFHLAQPGVYKVMLSATLSILFVFLAIRTLILVYQINVAPHPGTITVHPGVITTATAAAALVATPEPAAQTATAQAQTATAQAQAAATAAQATVAIELTLGAEARATLAALQIAPSTVQSTSTPTESWRLPIPHIPGELKLTAVSGGG